MQKLMSLVSCSNLCTNTVTDRQGQQSVIESFIVVLSDGIDSVVCETSKVVTAQFKQTPPTYGVYNCSIKFRVVAGKDDPTKQYMFATLLECIPLK